MITLDTPTTTITAFILVAAMLTSLAAMLIVNLLGAIDNILIEAKSPHFMQMHTGGFDMERLRRYAGAHDNVEAFQVLDYLNIDGAEIIIGKDALAWSVQDNGFSTQSKEFDFLLDLNNNVIQPADGEVYVPIYYMRQGAAEIGDTVTVCGVNFTVAGFLRDSQMNAALVSSKRFLVSDNDFEKIRDFGIMEYLIEFRLNDISQASAFESEYLMAELPANGPPAITFSIIRIVNAITDGIMIAVLVLISLLVIVVALLCIRFSLLAKIEEDYKEIGVLKAVGLRVSHIKKLYMVKYGAIAGVACLAGFIISVLVQSPFMENIRLYLGESNRFIPGLLFGFIGSALIFTVIMLYVNSVLRRFRKISAAQAVRFGAPQEKTKLIRGFTLSGNKLFSSNIFLGTKDVLSRKKLYITMLTVLIISSFIMNVPQNIYNTISARSFMTYMGIGQCDVTIGISQTLTDDVAGSTAQIADALAGDDSVSKYTVLVCKMFDMIAGDGSVRRLRVELGDHTAFPIFYSSGGMPQTEAEIAISKSNADELEKTVGDEILLIIDGEERRLTICGIYSDITNGGFTTKAVFEANQGEILWSSIPVTFVDGLTASAKVSQYREIFPFAKVSGVEEDIEQMFGATIAAVQIASRVSIGLTIALTVLVTLLFMKMLVAKDRYSVAILKSIGFNNANIRRQYITRGMGVLATGVVIGTLLSNTLGELVGVALISSFGASSFKFVVNPLFSYLFSPLLIALCVYVATLLGVSDIRLLKISEHIKEV
ncbi:MAG: ABC transporter permease [Oscillospiraceae bacterium]|jgi:putative ABC transport system permease protein|nr:ABC transporter permease [Oscillospiraceae bacterium]